MGVKQLKVISWLTVKPEKRHFTKPLPSLQTSLIWTGPVEQEKPQYTEEELERCEKRGAKITDKRWLQSEDGRLIIPENAQWKILTGLHQSFHLGAESTYQMASHLFDGKNVMKT